MYNKKDAVEDSDIPRYSYSCCFRSKIPESTVHRRLCLGLVDIK